MTKFTSDALNTLSERGFINQCTDLEALDKALAAGPVTAYCGYDPTAPSLHIGHLITIMMLHWLQHHGHKPITLMGGGTGLVGDPSFKDEARPLMTLETIAKNIAGMKQAFGPVIRYGANGNDALMLDNIEWLKDIGYLEFLRDYGPHISVNRMLSFDAIRTRLEREHHLSFLEFNYTLMQGYDFVELQRRYGCTLQVSGADQWANILSGVEMGRKKLNVTLHGLTASLLTDASGRKMGKSEGNALWLNPDLMSDYDTYQYWRNTDDSMVATMLARFTTMPMAEVRRLGALQGAEINEAKKILAHAATKLMRGEKAANDAAETARQTFEGAGRSEGLPQLQVLNGEALGLVDLLVRAGLAESKGEARRLIKGNGVRVNDTVMTDEQAILSDADFNSDSGAKLSVGKKKNVMLIKG